MNAPDKIYISTLNIDKGDNYWFIEESYNTANKKYDVEYIRKDVLLEWAKKEMGEWSSESTTAQGVKMGLTLVIDKIESL
jgi:hypothetical protein